MRDSLDELDDREFVHAALSDDVAAIRRYGDANPDSWTGVRFQNEPQVRIIASFVGDLERHEHTLRRLLAYPDRLLLEQAVRTKAQLDDMANEISRALRQREAVTGRTAMSRLGVGIGVVKVGLQADQEQLASELAERYGEALELEVGAFSCPMGHGRSSPPPWQGPEALEIEGLELRLQTERRVLEAGDRSHADLVVRNVGSRHIGPFDSGQPLLAVMLDDSGQVVGGIGHQAIGGTGLRIDLDPGDELHVGVLIGTASHREELGYLLPPGRYWLRTHLLVSEGEPAKAMTRALSPPLEEVTIVPRGSRASGGSEYDRP